MHAMVAGMLVVSLGGRSAGGNEPIPAPPASGGGAFNSTVAFRVFALKTTGGDSQLVGETPSAKPLAIPPCLHWWVAPLPPVEMAKVREEVATRRIPGLGFRVRLWGTSRAIGDDDLAHLKGLTALQTLDLSGCERVTDAGVAHLKGLTALQTLELNFTEVTDAGLAHLKGLTALQSLGLTGCDKVTDAGVADLKKVLPRLEISR